MTPVTALNFHQILSFHFLVTKVSTSDIVVLPHMIVMGFWYCEINTSTMSF